VVLLIQLIWLLAKFAYQGFRPSCYNIFAGSKRGAFMPDLRQAGAKCS